LNFINLTRRTEIGANSYFLGLDGKGIVLDSGMHPKEIGDEALPNFAALNGRPVDAIVLSHAHLDHIGSLPILMRQQSQAPVFMTSATAQIGDALLHNSVNVMTRQREEVGAAIYPLYGHREADRAVRSWRQCPLRQPITLAGERSSVEPNEQVDFQFWDAGHVLGAAGVLLRGEGRTIFYTGDVNFNDQALTKGAHFPDAGVDVLIIETTHGATPLPEDFSRKSEEGRFAAALNRVFARGGCVMVPVFALGKTQEILTLLYQLKRAQTIPDVPIYIGGLSAKMTTIYDRRASDTARVVPRLELFPEVQPFVLNSKTIRDAPAKPGRIYALSSGMMTQKTLSNIFGRKLMENPLDAIFFVGYADPASPAGLLRAAAAGNLVSLDEDEPAQTLRCEVGQFQFSSHAPRLSLLSYIEKLAPKKVVLVHGDPPAVEWMRSAAAEALPNSEILVPPPGVEIDL
jgi:Cft2 family RNA processing exonuclease